MDPVLAERMSKELIGQRIGGWLILRHIGDGKSAVVFVGENEGQQIALKVFDPELVERFGRASQLMRIERECDLIGENHPHLVQIYGGGECEESGYLYVAMEFIPAPNLKTVLTLVPRDKIASILKQIASAAQFLEEKGLAHRDIKPENIAVYSDFTRAVLLDLGVLRPIGNSDLTDEKSRVFIGTLQYSSPELLLRLESDDEQGWRAITFYQLGAVLHDLIMRRPIFSDFVEPFALLVEAVKNEKPIIHADDISADLVLLAQNCLVKPPLARLSLVSWEDFSKDKDTRRLADIARERVMKRNLLARSQSTELVSAPQLSLRQSRTLVVNRLDNVIRNECAGSNSFPQMQIFQNIEGSAQVQVVFEPSLAHELPQKLSICFDCELVDEATKAFNIVASACFLINNSLHGSPPEVSKIFCGPLDSRSLTSAVNDVLWCSIDFGQRQGEHFAQDSAVYWLNINQVLGEQQ